MLPSVNAAVKDALRRVRFACSAPHDQASLVERVSAVADAWFRYVKSHAFAWSMLFQDVTGDPEIRAFHAGMRDSARSAIAGLLVAEPTRLSMPSSLASTATPGRT